MAAGESPPAHKGFARFLAVSPTCARPARPGLDPCPHHYRQHLRAQERKHHCWKTWCRARHPWLRAAYPS